MTHGTPRRRRHDDRRRHTEQRRERRGQRGPTREEIDQALDRVQRHDLPGTPPVWALETLSRSMGGAPIEVGGRKVRSYSITSGDPTHGEMRSDDHVGRYEVEHPRRCPDCGYPTLVYEYHAHHFIAGGDKTYCEACETVHDSNDWG